MTKTPKDLVADALTDSLKREMDMNRIITEQDAKIARLTAENSGLAQMLEGQRIELAQARAALTVNS